MEQFFKAFESGQQKIEILRDWDIANIAHSYRNVLEVDSCSIISRAHLSVEVVVEVFGVDDAVLPLPPAEEVKIAVELLCTFEFS